MAQASATPPAPSASFPIRSPSSVILRQRGVLSRRIAAIKQRYENSQKEVADEIEKLSRTHPPSRYAFIVLVTVAILMDTAVDVVVEIANIAAFLGVAVDVVITASLMLCLRAMINRSKGAQRFFATLLAVGLLISLVFVGIGAIIGVPMILVVVVAGIWNPGVKVHKVDKARVQQKIKQFEKSIQTVRQRAARLIRAGKRSQSALVRGAIENIAKPRTLKAFSSGSKTLSRFLGTFVGEIIPYISLIPFNTITAYLTYRDLKRAHAEAAEMLALHKEQRDAAIAAESAVAQAEYEQRMEEAADEAVWTAEEFDMQQETSEKPAPVRQGNALREQPLQRTLPPQTPPRDTMRDVTAAPAAPRKAVPAGATA